MKERLDYIDRAKGILIILMVIGHIWNCGFVFDVLSAFHMPAFFVISGFLTNLTQSYRKPFGQFLKTRVFSFVIPFLFVETLGVLTDIARNGVTLNIKGYIYNTVTLNYNDTVNWFLVVLCVTEVMFWLISRVVENRSLMCILAAALFVLRYFLPVEWLYVGTLSNACKHLLFYVVGFCGYKKLVARRNDLAAVCCAVVLALVLFGGGLSGKGWAAANLVYLVKALCGSYAILQLSQLPLRPLLGRILANAGQNSIIIFGTHHFYYVVLGMLLGVTDFACTPLLKGLVILLAVGVLEIPTIYIINRWLPILAGKRRRKSATA